jgi:WD40 repeat protein
MHDRDLFRFSVQEKMLPSFRRIEAYNARESRTRIKERPMPSTPKKTKPKFTPQTKTQTKNKTKAKSSPASLTPVWKDSPIASPQEYINSVAISQDGSTVVAGTYYFPYGAGAKHSPADTQQITVGTFAWNAQGKQLWQDKFLATEGVYWVAVSRDGKWAAACGRTTQAQGFVYIYNAATGARVSTYNTKIRVNMVAFSSDGSYLVAGADDTYLFTRAGATWSPPQILPSASGDSVIAVGFSADGQWTVAGTFMGAVVLAKNTAGKFATPVTWQMKGSIHWIAMSADGSTFAAAPSGSSVYCFTTANFGSTKQPAWTGPLTGCTSCRTGAVCDDGSLVSAGGNVGTAGKVFLFSNQKTSGKQLWSQPTQRNPNSTSLDTAGKFVTAADGYPDQTPGDFYLYDAGGNALGSFQTNNMSWPMQISANGSAIAAGSDDSNVYYFAVP